MSSPVAITRLAVDKPRTDSPQPAAAAAAAEMYVTR